MWSSSTGGQQAAHEAPRGSVVLLRVGSRLARRVPTAVGVMGICHRFVPGGHILPLKGRVGIGRRQLSH